MNKKTTIPAPVGGSSLLVIFAVLCLTVFALLGLATVTADKRLADDNYEAIRAYYEADCQAEQILAEIRAGLIPEEVSLVGEDYVYKCTISDTQELVVKVAVNGTSYKVKEWRVTETTDWKPDEYMNVFEIEDF